MGDGRSRLQHLRREIIEKFNLIPNGLHYPRYPRVIHVVHVVHGIHVVHVIHGTINIPICHTHLMILAF